MHAPGSATHINAKIFRYRSRQCRIGRARVQGHLATEKGIGHQVAERDVGIGEGWLVTAAAVTGRAWICTGAAWSNGEQVTFIDSSDRSAACADLDHVYHRDTQGETAALLKFVLAGNLNFVAPQSPPSTN